MRRPIRSNAAAAAATAVTSAVLTAVAATVTSVVLTVVATFVVVPLRPAPAAAAPAACPGQPPPSLAADAAQPWAQKRFDLNRLAQFADGRDIKVAVIDSGVDSSHPQLRGHVSAGQDFLDAGGDGRQDCVGHGTAVASVIVAQTTSGVGLRGLARGASILPIRVSEQVTDQGGVSGRAAANPSQAFATAIRYAADHDARVINISLVLADDDPAVRAATEYALSKNVVVVAAVGNGHPQSGAGQAGTAGQQSTGQPDPTPYPAGYAGVIGVGGIDQSGTRFGTSQVGDYVDIVAPGSQVTVAVPADGYQLYDGTSVATPFVSAAAALVMQYHPELSAREVTARILATADPAPGRRAEYGRGTLNPYRALTESVAANRPKELDPVPPPRVDPAAARTEAAAARTRTVAVLLAAGMAALALLVVIIATVVPRGRRRGWRPGAG
jgi:type VII secretion-associated serine protease mycosin